MSQSACLCPVATFNQRRAFVVAGKFCSALGKFSADAIVSFLVENKYWVRKKTNIVKPFRGYQLPGNWNLHSLFRWKILPGLIYGQRLILDQASICVLPSLRAPASYGYEEETDTAILLSTLNDDSSSTEVYPLVHPGVCEVINKKNIGQKTFFVSPGALVSLNTVVNLCADVIEHGGQEAFWPSVIGSEARTRMLGFFGKGKTQEYVEQEKKAWNQERALASLFVESYRRNKDLVQDSLLLREFSKHLAKCVGWLGGYNAKYRQERMSRLSEIVQGFNTANLNSVHRDMALI